MYCNQCGEELREGSQFCPRCGHPVGMTGIYPSPLAPMIPRPWLHPLTRTENIILGLTAILFGISMISGGITAIITLVQYTMWIVAGGISLVLAGICCALKGGGMLKDAARK